HGEFRDARRRRRYAMEDRERHRRQRERGGEDAEALQLVTEKAVTADDTEGEPSVGSGVCDRGGEQRNRVGGLCADGMAQDEVEQEVGESADDADGAEAEELRPV